MTEEREITNNLDIAMYMHCGKCMAQKPVDKSPAEFADLAVGWTPIGLQVWCNRHEINVLHIDFEGQKLPANTTANGGSGK